MATVIPLVYDTATSNIRQFSTALSDTYPDVPAASFNGLNVVENTTGFSLTGGLTTNKTITISNNLTLSGTDGATLNIVGGGTLGSAAFTASSAYQAPLVSGTNISTVNGNSLLTGSNITVQPTLVSGTSIVTINGNSLLGSGNLNTNSPVTTLQTFSTYFGL